MDVVSYVLSKKYTDLRLANAPAVSGTISEGKTNFFSLGKNLLNKNALTNGFKLNSDGKTMIASATSATTEYIHCQGIPSLYLYRVSQLHLNSLFLAATYYYYDAEYNLISSEVISSGSTNKYSTVQNAHYARLSYTTVADFDLMLISGTDVDAVPYESYEFGFNYVTKQSDDPINLVKNKYTGYTMNANGAGTSVGYSVTNFIPVKAGKTYYIERFRNLLMYSSIVNVKAGSLITTEARLYTFTPEQDGYVRFSVADTYKDYAFMCEVKGYALNFGDSVADGDGNDDRSYAHMVAQNKGFAVINYALGGATLGWADSPTFPLQNIIQQVEDAVAQVTKVPTLILMDGGTNDSTTGVTLGTKTSGYKTTKADYAVATTLGATEYLFSLLKTTYPTAKLVFVKTHVMGSKPSALVDIENAIHDVCNKWSVAVADVMQDSGMNTFLDAYVPYTRLGDKTHPNEQGYKLFYLPIVDKKVTEVLGY